MRKLLNQPRSRRQVILYGTTLFLGGCASMGQKVDEGSSDYIPYLVQEGETLYDLCRRTGLSKAEIMDYNNLDSENLIAGQVLRLPRIDEYPDEPVTTHRSQDSQDQKDAPYRPNFPNKPMQRPDMYQDNANLVFVSRAQWGAEPIKFNHNPMNGINKITIHHTSEYPGMDSLNDLQIVQKIARFHRENRHWADIGYHYLIGRDGRIYEGRPIHIQGAHVRSGNENNLGISVIGDFSNRNPNTLQIKALNTFVAQQQRRYGIPNTRVYGHRDLNPTECPGDGLYYWLSRFRLSQR